MPEGSSNPTGSTSIRTRRTIGGAAYRGFGDQAVTDYAEQVVDRHGYIRFLGLPHLRDVPDVRIDRLFVEPSLAPRWISPDTPPDQWNEVRPAVDVLHENQRAVLLGDPGSGKSTVVDWIAWHLARRGESPWVEKLGRLLPVPIVLRELSIGDQVDWDGLLDAFMAHPVGQPLGSRERLEPLLEKGQAIILLDGLDEIGSVAVRKALRDAVFEGMERYPNVRWLLTSRIVGYEDVPFDRESESDEEALTDASGEPLMGRDPSGWGEAITAGRSGKAALRYMAPFEDRQVERFVLNWFHLRESTRQWAPQGVRNLLDAIYRDKTTTRLARNPNLLTLMALVHRVRAYLPNGRAMLYHDITEAYLESIDRFRGLPTGEQSLTEKRRWLARVGFEMQRRREAETEGQSDEPSAGGEILVDADEVQAWILEAMEASGRGRDVQAADDFLAHVARRSGLLLPRAPTPDGRSRYAFMHLSFQEYFAACYLEEQILSPPWLRKGRAGPGTSREELRRYANREAWQETLVFLFEALAHRPGWPTELADTLFGDDLEDIDPNDENVGPAAVLLARLAVDPHSGFSSDMRRNAVRACCEWELEHQNVSKRVYFVMPVVFPTLFSAEREQIPSIWEVLVDRAASRGVTKLALFGPIRDITPLSALTGLERLIISSSSVIDLRPLSALENLKVLVLLKTVVTDLEPLAALQNLEILKILSVLYATPIVDDQIQWLRSMLPRTRIHYEPTREGRNGRNQEAVSGEGLEGDDSRRSRQF